MLFPDIEKVFACFKYFRCFVGGRVLCPAFEKKINKQGVSTIESYVGAKDEGGVRLIISLFFNTWRAS